MGICIASVCAGIPPQIWQCSPISYAWDVWTGERKVPRVNINALVWAWASINIALDIAVIILPMPQLLKLNLSRKKKIQVIAMFSVGLL